MEDQSVARREALVLGVIALLFGASLLPALVAARQERRDGARREQLAALKHALELFQNDRGHYPAPPDAPRLRCGSSLDAGDWFFRSPQAASLRKHLRGIPRDPRFPERWDVRYCVTAADAEGATAFLLRTRLERRQEPRAAFDAEEGHNYYFRVTREGTATFYDICGGTDSCGTTRRP